MHASKFDLVVESVLNEAQTLSIEEGTFGDWEIVKIKDQLDFVKYGKGGRWSPAQSSSDGRRMFEIYTKEGHTFYVATNTKTGVKYAFDVKGSAVVGAFNSDDYEINLKNISATKITAEVLDSFASK